MNKQELIENYFLGRLSEKEKQTFNDLLLTDLAFKESFMLQENLQKVIEVEEDENFKAMLEGFENELQPKSKNYTKWLVAASVLVLFGLSYFALFQENSTNEDLFAQNFEPYRNVIQPIERSKISEDIKTKAFAFYEKGEYQDAILLFSELQKTEKENYFIFYKANSYLAIKNTSEAIPLLKKYLEIQGQFKDKAQWYLALAFLKEKNTNEAEKILHTIIRLKTYNHEKASLILNELK